MPADAASLRNLLNDHRVVVMLSVTSKCKDTIDHLKSGFDALGQEAGMEDTVFVYNNMDHQVSLRNVQTVPNMRVYRRGVLVREFHGFTPGAKYSHAIQSACGYTAKATPSTRAPEASARVARQAPTESESIRFPQTASALRTEKSRRGVIVIMHGASWCGNCRRAKPKFVALANKHQGHMVFVYNDLDLVPIKHIRSIPTFELYKDGKLINTITGAKLSALKAAIDAI